MSGLWSTLKGKEKPATSIVNDDAVEVEDPPRGAPIRSPGPRMSFKPMSSESVMETQSEALPLRAPVEFAEDNFLDLITPDPPPMPKSGGAAAGRPRQYASNAERQAAYRARKQGR